MNTDSIMAVWIFCFGAVWAARPVLKNNIVGILWAILKGVFFIFSGAKKSVKIVIKTLYVVSALKSCIK